MPRIVASAIKFKQYGCEYFDIMCGKRHNDILYRMFTNRINYDRETAVQGFLTDANQFVDRYDAYCLACDAGQIEPKVVEEYEVGVPQLYSEDLW